MYVHVYIHTHTQFPMEKINAVRMHLKVLFKAIFSKFYPHICNVYTQSVFFFIIWPFWGA